jgi:hypothetical protein
MYYTDDEEHYIVDSYILASHHNKELNVLPAEDKVHSSEY